MRTLKREERMRVLKLGEDNSVLDEDKKEFAGGLLKKDKKDRGAGGSGSASASPSNRGHSMHVANGRGTVVITSSEEDEDDGEDLRGSEDETETKTKTPKGVNKLLQTQQKHYSKWSKVRRAYKKSV